MTAVLSGRPESHISNYCHRFGDKKNFKMSVVDQYLKWANATGNVILDWARPAGAPIGITSVSSLSVVVTILTHGYCTHYSRSDYSLISIYHQLLYASPRLGHLRSSAMRLRSLCATSDLWLLEE